MILRQIGVLRYLFWWTKTLEAVLDFVTLPKGAMTLDNLTIPDGIGDEAVQGFSIGIEGGTFTTPGVGARIDMKGSLALPAFVDMHTHLDKGHIWSRRPNPDGSFAGALDATAKDKAANWTATDVARRMDFALRCAWAHGTRAIRTHLDTFGQEGGPSWPAFARIRDAWAGRIDLQAVSLVGISEVDGSAEFQATANLVAAHGGSLGVATYPDPDIETRLHTFFESAGHRGLHADLHVDETLDPNVANLRAVARAVLDTGFDRPVTVGHCCSLVDQEEREAMTTLDLVAEAGLDVVSLPLCNLYLQDRHPSRTPRLRGVTLVHEMKARGINVSFASDNTRDPFYAYGDLDMLEVMREATRIAHLDHADPDWMRAFFGNPSTATGFRSPVIASGEPADMIICRARTLNELLARPQSDRVVIRNGKQIDRRLPDYAELDDILELA